MLENQENQPERVIQHKISRENMISLQQKIYYSDKYTDEEFEYRHVLLPKEIAKWVPKNHLMSEGEWRSIGVQQSHGWMHYMRHNPEPHVLLFRRRLPEK
ncbi:cyclin-dependent kinases regulatory subunit [Aplysia californica]|uniref:Cyclin-dependent kinases regulatory subunit n=1 Tax=Aplysia californica TaxID=6500 RepID=A0ABM0ZZ11_APLCA|nr:cyclin-dependent kinases regulatory subunit [Aplysia californica]